MRSIILSIRNNNFKFADAVVEYGMRLIRKHKSSLGDECKYFFILFYFKDYVILEEVFYAGVDLRLLNLSSVKYFKYISIIIIVIIKTLELYL